MGKLTRFINNKIREQDMFGHSVVLNFNKDGESHKTVIGGLGSLLV